MMKKTLDSQKNTRLQRILTHSASAQKMHCSANHRHCATHYQRERERENWR